MSIFDELYDDERNKKKRKKKINKALAKERDVNFVKLLEDQQVLYLTNCSKEAALNLIQKYTKQEINYSLINDLESIWENQSFDRDLKYRLAFIRLFSSDQYQSQYRESLEGNISDASLNLNDKSRYIADSLIKSALELPFRIFPYWKNINEMTLPRGFTYFDQKFAEGNNEHFFRGAGSRVDKPLQSHILKTAEELGAKPIASPKKAVKKAVMPKECDYIKNNNAATLEASPSHFNRIRKKVTLGKAKEGQYMFEGASKLSDALFYDASLGKKKIRIVMPKTTPKGKFLPSAHQLANALGAVPTKQLNNIVRVVANVTSNPHNSYFSKQFGIPDFTSAAAGGNNGVTFYPQDFSWNVANIDSTMIHEGGHTYSQNLWSNKIHKQNWLKAIKKDGVTPSKYAEGNESEDFSESLVMYSISKGTTCEAFAKKKYPGRYKVLDELLK